MRISDWSSDVCSSDLDRHRRPQGDRRAARQLRAHGHPGPVPAGMVARARRRAQGRTATSQPAERALRGRGPLMLDTVVAVPLWVLLAGSALCLLIAILIAVYLRHTLHQSARFAGERGAHDTHEAAQALQIQLKEALVDRKSTRLNSSH